MAGEADLNDIGVLRRREIEARILAPLVEAFAAEFGRERVVEVARRVIVEIARAQGRELAAAAGGDDLRAFAATKEPWTRNGALELEVLRQTDREYDFNVTRCRYAELYRALGIPELGTLLSCNRDFALGSGFNPRMTLTRTQTIMDGAPYCDFRYRLEPPAPSR
jgi:L-2-amino-thiazoline-4-carboxylic acid hydrolase-like protein